MVAAVICAESGFDAHARGWLGEVGPMQVIPRTAAHLCLDLAPFLWEPAPNVRCGIRVLLHAEEACGGPGAGACSPWRPNANATMAGGDMVGRCPGGASVLHPDSNEWTSDLGDIRRQKSKKPGNPWGFRAS